MEERGAGPIPAILIEAMGLHRAGRLAEAEALYRQVLASDPSLVNVHVNLGAALQGQDRVEAAVDAYRAALALAPDNTAALSNLGVALRILGQLDEALARQDAAMAREPRSAAFTSNRALVLQDLGRVTEATAAFEQATALDPDFAVAHFGLGCARLLAGDFASGWPQYEWRLARKAVAQPQRPGPRWDGGDLAGKTLLLQCEQGLGDAIQFIRYAALLSARGARVLVSCPAPLRTLFHGVAGIDAVIDEAAPPPFDLWTPLLSTPGLVGARLETIPAPGAYLQADPARIDHWRARLAGRTGLRVGLAWRGSPEHVNDRNRSLAAARLAPALDAPGLSLVSLQKDARPDELAALGPDVFDAGPNLVDIAETAAVIANLDLVLTVDSAVAHLAGAVGARTLVMVPFSPDWRWLLGRVDSPWYPSLRLFRQPAPGDWTGAIAAAGEALARALT
jgi:thioredoxin-like negative regulator of GroEL